MQEGFQAKIFRSGKRRFECKIDGKDDLVEAIAPAQVLKNSHPVVGDNVILQKAAAGDAYDIVEVVERENEIYRRIVRENKKKVIAANLDVMFIVTAVSKPDYKPGLIDRYILRALEWDIPAVIIFNKMDQFEDQFDLKYETLKYEKLLGIQTFKVSSEDPDSTKKDLDTLLEKLNGKTAIALGQSGVGKSKLISTLSGGKIELLSRRLAKGVEKGSHTTTWAEIIDCEKFLMVDSPGVRSLSVLDVPKEELPSLFPDLEEYFIQCKFKDCRHEEKSKGCAFQNLDPEVDLERAVLERLESFKKMRDEVESIPEWQKN